MIYGIEPDVEGTVRLHDITVEDIMGAGVWVEPPEGAVSATYPDNFEKFTDERRAAWFQATARCMYISQCHHVQTMLDEFKNRWDAWYAGTESEWKKNPLVSFQQR